MKLEEEKKRTIGEMLRWNSKWAQFEMLHKELVAFQQPCVSYLSSFSPPRPVVLFAGMCWKPTGERQSFMFATLKKGGSDHKRDRACELFIGAVGSGLEKCLFECLLYLQTLKEMHSTMDGFIYDSNTSCWLVTFRNRVKCTEQNGRKWGKAWN